VFWKLSSTSGANVGSLRAQAVAVEATVRDTLVLAFRLDDASLEVTRLGPDKVGCVGCGISSGTRCATRPPRWPPACNAGAAR